MLDGLAEPQICIGTIIRPNYSDHGRSNSVGSRYKITKLTLLHVYTYKVISYP